MLASQMSFSEQTKATADSTFYRTISELAVMTMAEVVPFALLVKEVIYKSKGKGSGCS